MNKNLKSHLSICKKEQLNRDDYDTLQVFNWELDAHKEKIKISNFFCYLNYLEFGYCILEWLWINLIQLLCINYMLETLHIEIEY